jgi:tRNA uridine 5-carbamoylmethylation protein Kti12
MHGTIVVNVLGGPGVGKSTEAALLFGNLKKRGYICEQVLEYAKELVWEKNLELLSDQKHVYLEQKRRLDRLYGVVDVITTDASLLNSIVYAPESYPESFRKEVLHAFGQYRNFNVYLDPAMTYENIGRLQNKEESDAIGVTVLNLLKQEAIPFTRVKDPRSYPDLSGHIAQLMEDTWPNGRML